jgi:hypothetical protein
MVTEIVIATIGAFSAGIIVAVFAWYERGRPDAQERRQLSNLKTRLEVLDAIRSSQKHELPLETKDTRMVKKLEPPRQLQTQGCSGLAVRLKRFKNRSPTHPFIFPSKIVKLR